MQFDVIRSGSSGNATIVISNNQVIQIDFGIAKKHIVNALNSYSFTLNDIQAFLITHSHSDHIGCIKYAPSEKIRASNPVLGNIVIPNERIVKPFQPFNIGVFTITPFPLSHDASNTVGYVIDDGDERLVYATDTGFLPEKDFRLLTNADYYIFESNHDIAMLYNSDRSLSLIKRIHSDKGHLSNEESANYLATLIGKRTKEIVLAHLSHDCNSEEIALNTIAEVFKKRFIIPPDVRIVCASREHELRGGR